MRKLLFFWALVVAFIASAQKVEYQTFIYTSDDLGKVISQVADEQKTRGFWADIGEASLDATKGIASGYVTSFLDFGINAIANLITKNKKDKEDWEKIVAAENVCETHIKTLSEINDFYDQLSSDGPLDPKGMRFDGIGCLRKIEEDTVFYISCHIDRSKISRIIKHSKFELVLDTLIISPTHSNLPNSLPKRDFSFNERKDFLVSLDIKINSSWMGETGQLQKDQELGAFSLSMPVTKDDLDAKGRLKYVRGDVAPNKYIITGESFIVPRSYMGYHEGNEFKNSWGTGEFKLDITIKESCGITDEFRKNWKVDYKRRKSECKKGNILQTTWQTVSHQKWDEITKSWVITTLKAPAGVITKDVNKMFGIKPSVEVQAGNVK